MKKRLFLLATIVATFAIQKAASQVQCSITNVVAEIASCQNDSFFVHLDFDATGGGPLGFKVFGSGFVHGQFPYSTPLPMTIGPLPANCTTDWEFVVKDVSNSACSGFDEIGPVCCDSMPPGGDCEIFDLAAIPLVCNADGTYKLKINFQVANPPVPNFKVFAANGTLLGTFSTANLPVVVNFPPNGNPIDAVKVCMNDAPNCCKIKEFAALDCNGPCEISNLTATTLDCNADGTYQLKINFQVANAPIPNFKVWAANGTLLGTFSTANLPVIVDFPPSGNPIDAVKVCMNDTPNCCKVKEFVAPDCNGPCEIFDAVALPLECNADGTYRLKINFQVQNPGNALFEIWAGNGTFLGTHPLASLPFIVPNFPPSGAAHDKIKICINDHPDCCKILEFAALECEPQSNCKIWDLTATATPCLLGYFFVLVQFNHQNGGSGGVKVTGNGQWHGTFPYSTPQPIILGPFQGSTTDLEFAATDVNHPDCHDSYHLGPVTCATATGEVEPFQKPKLVARPTATDGFFELFLENAAFENSGELQIFNLAGQSLFSKKAAKAATFQIDGSSWPTGFYLCSWRTEKGVLTARVFKN